MYVYIYIDIDIDIDLFIYIYICIYNKSIYLESASEYRPVFFILNCVFFSLFIVFHLVICIGVEKHRPLLYRTNICYSHTTN